MQFRLVPVLLALSLAVPTAISWSVSGSFEPDTPDDLEGQRIWPDTDTSPSTAAKRVYFNAHPKDMSAQGLSSTGFSTAVNPNLGATQSRVIPAAFMSFAAYLGFWKDCNDDGYIGHVESALWEYNSALLLDDSICPPGTYFHHHGWVSEFIPIGDVAPLPNSAAFPRILRDDEAMVWGDFGRPGREDEVHYDCLQAPFPRGTFDSTAGLLVYVDCQLGYNVAKNVNAVDPTGTLGFEDPYNPERDCDSTLNQPLDTYGRDPCNPDDTGLLQSNTSRPMFTVFDCSAEPEKLYDVRDPTGLVPREQALAGGVSAHFQNENGTLGFRLSESEDGVWLERDGVAPPAPMVGDTDGSAYEGYQNVGNGAGGCDAEPAEDGLEEGLLGADITSTNPTDGKQTADFEFGYTAPGSGVGAVASNLPQNAGVRPASNGHWDASMVYLPPTYLGPTLRTSDLAPAGGIWFTFYANVGVNTTAAGGALPPLAASAGFYGAEACGGSVSGVLNGWDCDKEHWYSEASPGSAYRLRDTDCYDGTLVGGVPVYASLALADERDGPCPVV